MVTTPMHLILDIWKSFAVMSFINLWFLTWRSCCFLSFYV